jgi:hypothetical protein
LAHLESNDASFGSLVEDSVIPETVPSVEIAKRATSSSAAQYIPQSLGGFFSQRVEDWSSGHGYGIHFLENAEGSEKIG